MTKQDSTAHTPAPWCLPHFAQPDVNCKCEYIIAEHGGMGAVASIYCSGDGDDWQANGDNPKFQEAVANAHLIAAAPELLAAAKNACQQLEDMGFDGLSSGLVDAIAKAEGNT